MTRTARPHATTVVAPLVALGIALAGCGGADDDVVDDAAQVVEDEGEEVVQDVAEATDEATGTADEGEVPAEEVPADGGAIDDQVLEVLPEGFPVPDGATVDAVLTPAMLGQDGIGGTVQLNVAGATTEELVGPFEGWVAGSGWELDIDGDFESLDGVAYVSRSYRMGGEIMTFNVGPIEDQPGVLSYSVSRREE